MKTTLPVLIILLSSLLALPAMAVLSVNSYGTGEYPTIQAALDAAGNGDVVELYPGTYRGAGNHDLEFYSNVTLRSMTGYAYCFIDCQGTSESPAGGFNLAEESGGTIEGITIQNAWLEQGAAISSGSGTYTFYECQFLDNYANDSGGVLKAEAGSNVIFENCLFSHNKAANNGGALWGTTNSSLTVRSCTFVRNGATNGGSIYLDVNASVAVENSLIVWGFGGAAFDGYYFDTATFSCTNIFHNSGGDWVNGAGRFGSNGNISVDPLLVDPMADPPNLYLSQYSPCSETYNACGRMGALPRLLVPVFTYGLSDDGEGMFATIQDAVQYIPDNQSVVLEDGTFMGEGNSGVAPVGKSITIQSRSDDPGYCRIFLDDSTTGAFVFNNNGTQTEVRGVSVFSPPLESNVIVEMSGNQDITFRNCRFGYYGDLGESHAMVFQGEGTLSFISCDMYHTEGFLGFLKVTGSVQSPDNIVSFNDCLFYRNTVSSEALIELDQFNLDIENCNFRMNFSDTGAGILVNQGDVQIRNSEFFGNYLNYSSVLLRNCTGSMTDCSFGSNEANHSAGGLSLDMSDFQVTDCRFESNKTGGNGGGASVWANEGESTIKIVDFNNCEFIENEAHDNGSGIYAGANGLDILNEDNQELYVTLTNCTFHGNKTVNETANVTHSQVYSTRALIYHSGNVDLDLNYCLITAGKACKGVYKNNGTNISIQCSDIKGNELGDWVGSIATQLDYEGNLSVYPYYCHVSDGDFSLNGISECLPDNNICGAQIGANGEGCSGMTDVPEPSLSMGRSRMIGNAPNPFNPSTILKYELGRDTTVTLHIYNVHGQLVRVLLHNEMQSAGSRQIQWNGRDDGQRVVAAGVYFARMEAEGVTSSHKMILIK